MHLSPPIRLIIVFTCLLAVPLARAVELSARLAIHIEALKPAGQQLVDLYGTKNGPIECRAFFKDGASRTEYPAAAGAFSGHILLGTVSGQIHQLAPEAQAYTTWLRPAAAKPPKLTPQRTGRTQTIAGYACEQVIFELSRDETYEYWVTKDLPGLKAMDVADNALDVRRRAMFRQLDGVPVRIISTHPNVRMTIELSAIKQEPLDVTLFEIPTGYVHAKDASDLMKKNPPKPKS